MVKALRGGERLRFVTQVPFADHLRGIAERLEQIGDGDFVGVQANVGARSEYAGHAQTWLIAACHQRSPRGRADAVGGVEAREADALCGQAVDGGTLDVRRAVAAQVLVALIVGEDQHHVGALCVGSCRRPGNDECKADKRTSN